MIDKLEVRWFFYQQNRLKNRIKSQVKMSVGRLETILRNDLGIQRGDTVCVHSALGFLNLEIDPAAVLELLLNVVGTEGTLVFPTYPGASQEFLKSNQIFDVKSTSSVKSTGLLTDLAWRSPGARRSLHPTKSMAAIGPNAEPLIKDHHLSAFPYDRHSPYYKLTELGAKIIGLGVWTYNLSFVHCIEDTMKERFPFCPHAPELYRGRCKDSVGRESTILTYAHDLKRISLDTLHVQDYMKAHVVKQIADDMVIDSRRFFRVSAKDLYPRMCELGDEGITIFRRAQRRTSAPREREQWILLQEQVQKTKGSL